MARRVRLNKRVAVLLLLIGGLLVALVVAAGFQGMFRRVGDWLFPKDPAVLAARAEEAVKAEDYDLAFRSYGRAIQAAQRLGTRNVHEHYYHCAQVSRQWAQRGTGLTQTERGEKVGQAIRLLNQALLLKGDYLDAQKLLCEIYYEAAVHHAENWPTFLREVDKLLKLEPNDAEACFRRAEGKASLSQGMEGDMAREAIVDFRRAVQLQKDQPRYWMRLIGFLTALRDRGEEVEKTFQEALQADPNSPQTMIAYAAHLEAKGDVGGAEKMLRGAVEKDPMVGSLALAQHYAQRGRRADALEVLAKARRLDSLDARTYLVEAALHIQQEELPKAADLLREGLKAVGASLETQPAGRQRQAMVDGRFRLSYMLGDVLLDELDKGAAQRDKLLAEARSCRDALASTLPGTAFETKLNGRLLLAEGKPREAMEQLEKAYSAFPGVEAKTANVLINLYLHLGLPGKAEEILDRVLRMPGQLRNVPAVLAKARLLMRYRSYDQAEGYVAQVLRVDPNNVEGRNLRLALAAARGETMRLPPDLPLTPQAVAMLLDHVTALWTDGRRQEALAAGDQLLQRAADDLNVVIRMANLYRLADRAKRGEQLLADAISKHPDNQGLKRMLAILREPDPARQKELLLATADDLPALQRALQKSDLCGMLGDEQGRYRWLEAAGAVDPNAQVVVDRLFRYALARTDWRLAEDCVARAGKTNLDGVEGRMYAAQLAMARDDANAAMASAQEVLKVRPTDKAARMVLARCHLKKGAYNEAYDLLKLVERDDPGYAPTLAGLVAVTAALAKPAEHKEYVLRAWRLMPNDPYIREQHMRVLQETSSPQELIAERERTARQSPGDVTNLLQLALLYEQVGKLDKAEAILAGLHKAAPASLHAAQVLAAFYARHGRVEDLDKVMKPLLEAEASRPDVLVVYGELLGMLDPARAEEMLKQAIAIDPKRPRPHLAMARLKAARGDWADAAEAMETFIRLRGQDAGAIKDLVRYLIEARQYAAASQRLEKLLADNPGDAMAMTLKGAIAVRQGKIDEGLELFTRAAQADNTYAEPLVFRARVFLAKGQFDKARADLEAAKRLSGSPEIAMELARVYRLMRDLDQAELIYREIRGERKEYAPAIDQLIGIYLQRQKWKELEDLIAEARKLFPRNSAYCLAEAAMWQARQNVERRLEALAEAVRLAPEAPAPVTTYLLALADAGRYDAVLTISDKYVSHRQVGPWVKAVRAEALAKTGQPQRADALFLESLGSLPGGQLPTWAQQMTRAYGAAAAIARAEKWAADRAGDWRTQFGLALLYEADKKFAQAVGALTKAAEECGSADAKFGVSRQLGAVYYQSGEFRKAEQAYLAAEKIHSGDLQVVNNLAYLYANDLDEPKKALPYAADAARLRPDSARVLDTYGWTLAKLGQFAEAEQHLSRAVQLDQSLTVGYYHLGWVYEQTRRLEEALKAYRQGFEIVRTGAGDPMHKPLSEAVERVRRKLNTGSSP